MSKLKSKNKKGALRAIHIQAAIFLLIYFVVSKFVFFRSIADKNIYVSFIVPFLFGAITSSLFLYFFSHEDFFHFMKDVEKREQKQETKLLKKYKHFGKVAAVIAAGIIGGVILAALTVRILLVNYKYRYLLLVITMFFSTIVSVGFAKGLWGVIF